MKRFFVGIVFHNAWYTLKTSSSSLVDSFTRVVVGALRKRFGTPVYEDEWPAVYRRPGKTTDANDAAK